MMINTCRCSPEHADHRDLLDVAGPELRVANVQVPDRAGQIVVRTHDPNGEHDGTRRNPGGAALGIEADRDEQLQNQGQLYNQEQTERSRPGGAASEPRADPEERLQNQEQTEDRALEPGADPEVQAGSGSLVLAEEATQTRSAVLHQRLRSEGFQLLTQLKLNKHCGANVTL